MLSEIFDMGENKEEVICELRDDHSSRIIFLQLCFQLEDISLAIISDQRSNCTSSVLRVQ